MPEPCVGVPVPIVSPRLTSKQPISMSRSVSTRDLVGIALSRPSKGTAQHASLCSRGPGRWFAWARAITGAWLAQCASSMLQLVFFCEKDSVAAIKTATSLTPRRPALLTHPSGYSASARSRQRPVAARICCSHVRHGVLPSWAPTFGETKAPASRCLMPGVESAVRSRLDLGRRRHRDSAGSAGRLEHPTSTILTCLGKLAQVK